MRIAATFSGWTLEYIFSLPYPVFESIILRLDDLQTEQAKNIIMPGVIAALNGGDAVRVLIDESASIVSYKKDIYEYTEEELEEARERLKKATKNTETEKQC